jgi:hypothetical protein
MASTTTGTLTRKQLAARWNTSHRTIDRLRLAGVLPWIDLSAGHGQKAIVRFLEADILNYEKAARMAVGVDQ